MGALNSHRAKTPRPHLITIKEQTTFAQTAIKISKSSLDVVWVAKPKASQMAAVLLARLSGRKFFWIQSFSNPPHPSFFAKLLLAQADRIIVKNVENRHKLKDFGIERTKIRLEK